MSALCILVLSGCTIHSSTYYQPYAAGSKTLRTNCRGTAGPPTGILFEKNGVWLNIQIVKRWDDYPSLFITLDHLTAGEVIFPITKISATNTATGVTKNAVIDMVEGQKYEAIGKRYVTSAIDRLSEDESIFKSSDYSYYFIIAELPIGMPPRFKLRLPVIYIDGQEFNPGEIDVVMKTGTYTLPINC